MWLPEVVEEAWMPHLLSVQHSGEQKTLAVDRTSLKEFPQQQRMLQGHRSTWNLQDQHLLLVGEDSREELGRWQWRGLIL